MEEEKSQLEKTRGKKTWMEMQRAGQDKSKRQEKGGCKSRDEGGGVWGLIEERRVRKGGEIKEHKRESVRKERRHDSKKESC